MVLENGIGICEIVREPRCRLLSWGLLNFCGSHGCGVGEFEVFWDKNDDDPIMARTTALSTCLTNVVEPAVTHV